MTTDETIPFQYAQPVDEAYQARLARAIAFRGYRKPHIWIFFAVLFTLGVALMVVEGEAGFFGIWCVTMAVVLLLLPLLSLRSARKRLAKSLPAGSVIESGFGSEEFVVRGADGSSRVRYAAYERVRVEGEFVVLRPRGNKIDFYYPEGLFPTDARQRLVAAGARLS